jgi:hypothetical protein
LRSSTAEYQSSSAVAVEIGIVGQHPPEHGDVHRPVGPAQDQLLQILVLGQRLAIRDPIGQFLGHFPFLRRDEGERGGDPRLFAFLRLVDLAEDACHLGGDFSGAGGIGVLARQMCEQFLMEPFRPRADMAVEVQLEEAAFPQRPLDRLRRHPQPRSAADHGLFRATLIVAVGVRRAIAGQQVELHESRHSVVSSGVWIGASGAAGASAPK